jgi:hypothetical protein
MDQYQALSMDDKLKLNRCFRNIEGLTKNTNFKVVQFMENKGTVRSAIFMKPGIDLSEIK